MARPTWTHIKDPALRAWVESNTEKRQVMWATHFADSGYEPRLQEDWLKMCRTEEDVADAMSGIDSHPKELETLLQTEDVGAAIAYLIQRGQEDSADSGAL